MKEQIIAKAYAQSITDLADEQKLSVVDELTKLTETINSSNHLETALFLEVFTVEEKSSVLVEIAKRLKLSTLSKNFLLLLVQEKRLGLFPLIFKEMVVIDDHRKGFMRGVIEGSDEKVNAALKDKIGKYLKARLGVETDLQYVHNPSITAGYRVTVEDLQLDASIDNQLNKFKESILNH